MKAPEKLILASKSPRRAEILKAVHWPFEIMTSDVDETRGKNEDPVTYVRRLAQTKAEIVAERLRSSNRAALVLGADTVVVIGGEVLGQPADGEDARRMLSVLSGTWHEVLTGVALLRTGGLKEPLVEHEVSRVRFAEMSQAEIDWYVATGEPMDKAGAYAIQGRAALFIEKIEGDYFNVVGLPIRLVYRMLTVMSDE